jgi:tRNA U34 5-carboxymethylaminomethyl modifying GTPase MnmE/TrmE
MPTEKNIVLFGETGAGKSSVVNLIAGEKRAKTSSAMEHCTMEWEGYSITFDGHDYKVFDTAGLEDPYLGMEEYLETIVNAHDLITKLNNEGGIDLLLYCIRAGRVTTTIQEHYRLFHEWLCEKRVPVVLVLTGLEREHGSMEDWWTRNKRVFQRYKIHVAGHACITAASHLVDGRHKQLYEESRRLVHSLIIRHTYGSREGAYTDGGARELTLGKSTVTFLPEKKDILTILTKRCRMPPDTARQLASQIGQGLSRKSSTST